MEKNREFPDDARFEPRRWRDALQHIALAMLGAGDRISETDLRNVLARWLQETDHVDVTSALEGADGYVEVAKVHLGVLLEYDFAPTGEVEFGFRHRSVAEYLAASGLVGSYRSDPRVFLGYLHRARWRRVVEDFFAVLSDAGHDRLDTAIRLLLAETEPAEAYLLGNLRLVLGLVQSRLIEPSDRCADEIALRAVALFVDPANDRYADPLLAGIAALVDHFPQRAYDWVPADRTTCRSDVVALLAEPTSADATTLSVLLNISRGEFGTATQPVERVVFSILDGERFWDPMYIRTHRSATGDRIRFRYLCGCGTPHFLTDQVLERLHSLAFDTLTVTELVSDPRAAVRSLPSLLDTSDALEVDWEAVLPTLVSDDEVALLLVELRDWWWIPMLEYLAEAGDAAPLVACRLIEYLDDDSYVVDEYIEILIRGPRSLQDHAAFMLGINLGMLLIVDEEIDETGRVVTPGPETGRVEALVDRCMALGSDFSRLLLVVRTLGAYNSIGVNPQWTTTTLKGLTSDPSPDVRSAVRQLLTSMSESGMEISFAEFGEWWTGESAMPGIARTAGTAMRMREAVVASATSDCVGLMNEALHDASGPPPQTRGSVAVWRQHQIAEGRAREWAATPGDPGLWGLYILGRLSRRQEAVRELGAGIRSTDPITSRIAASAIQDADCQSVDWLEDALAEHLLGGVDGPTLANLVWTLDRAIVDDTARKRIGALAIDAMGFERSLGAYELAERMLLDDTSTRE